MSGRTTDEREPEYAFQRDDPVGGESVPNTAGHWARADAVTRAYIYQWAIDHADESYDLWTRTFLHPRLERTGGRYDTVRGWASTASSHCGLSDAGAARPAADLHAAPARRPG